MHVGVPTHHPLGPQGLTGHSTPPPSGNGCIAPKVERGLAPISSNCDAGLFRRGGYNCIFQVHFPSAGKWSSKWPSQCRHRLQMQCRKGAFYYTWMVLQSALSPKTILRIAGRRVCGPPSHIGAEITVSVHLDEQEQQTTPQTWWQRYLHSGCLRLVLVKSVLSPIQTTFFKVQLEKHGSGSLRVGQGPEGPCPMCLSNVRLWVELLELVESMSRRVRWVCAPDDVGLEGNVIANSLAIFGMLESAMGRGECKSSPPPPSVIDVSGSFT